MGGHNDSNRILNPPKENFNVIISNKLVLNDTYSGKDLSIQLEEKKSHTNSANIPMLAERFKFNLQTNGILVSYKKLRKSVNTLGSDPRPMILDSKHPIIYERTPELSSFDENSDNSNTSSEMYPQNYYDLNDSFIDDSELLMKAD